MKIKRILCLLHYDDDYEADVVHELKESVEVEEVRIFNYSQYFLAFGSSALEAEIERLLKDGSFDIALISSSRRHELRPEFLNVLRQYTRLVFMLLDEEIFMLAHSWFLAQTADAVLITDCYGRYFYEQLSIPNLLWESFYPESLYYPKPATKKKYDVSFVGVQNRGERLQYIQYLMDNGIEVARFGAGTAGGKLGKEEMIQVFRESKINLNFTGMYQEPWVLKEFPFQYRFRQHKGRPIEAAMSGSFCLTEYAADMKEIFTQGKEIDQFTDKTELLSKVRYYLNNEEKRETMAQAACKRALENYELSKNWRKKLAQLEQIFTENEHSRPVSIEIRKNRIYETTLASFYLTYALIALKHGKIKNTGELFSRLIRMNPLSIGRGIFHFIRYTLFKTKTR